MDVNQRSSETSNETPQTPEIGFRSSSSSSQVKSSQCMYVFAKDAVDLEVLKVGCHPPADALPAAFGGAQASTCMPSCAPSLRSGAMRRA